MLRTITGDDAVAPPTACDPTTTTFFSGLDFAITLSKALSGILQPLAIPVSGSGPPRKMCGAQEPARYWSRYVSLAPYALHASPGWVHELDLATLKGIITRLQGIRTRTFVWNVRFDHTPLATGLISLGLESQRTPTHVLYLTRDYDDVFARYSASIRNHVRKARRRGVVVRDAHIPEDVHAYYQMHMRLVRLKQQTGRYGYIYPVDLFLELAKLHGAGRLLIAEWEGRVIGGGLFIRDGWSVIYFHGASDRDYSHLYPLCAVLNEAIRWACSVDAAFFNFSGSAGIVTLERFKVSWGARRELNWSFQWSNPLWVQLSRIAGAVAGGNKARRPSLNSALEPDERQTTLVNCLDQHRD